MMFPLAIGALLMLASPCVGPECRPAGGVSAGDGASCPVPEHQRPFLVRLIRSGAPTARTGA